MTAPVLKRPGQALANRPLHFIWLVDCSGSMEGDKMQAVNHAIQEALPAMREVAAENPNATLLLRAITFSSGARWHVSTPTPVDQFVWQPMQTSGLTDMGEALKLVASELTMEKMSDRALPPVLVLMSDGLPTDDFNAGLNELMALPWGMKAVRISIAIGDGEYVDLDVLQQFIGHNERQPLIAKTAAQLAAYIRWASTVVVKEASSPSSQMKGAASSATNVTLPPPPVTISSSTTVF